MGRHIRKMRSAYGVIFRENLKEKDYRVHWIIKAARPLEIFLGIIFLLGAFMKAIDLNLFAVQIEAYGVLSDKALHPLAALSTLTVELLLAAALLLGVRLRLLTYALYQGLLLLFTGLILYGWYFHGLEDCGCFGALEMSPGISIAKNVLLALLGALAAIGFYREPHTPPRFALVKMGAAVLLSIVVLLYGYHDLKAQDLDHDEAEAGPYARFVFDTEFGPFDLGHGEYIVPLLSMSCEHCLEETPNLNDLMFMPEVPPMVALCLEENEGDMDRFKALAQPLFPLHSLGGQVRLFFNLIGKETLGVCYVRDGHPVHYWDGVVPEYDELMEVIRLEEPADTRTTSPIRLSRAALTPSILLLLLALALTAGLERPKAA